MSGKKGKKLKRVLFGLEIVILLLFLGGLYVYGQISARMTKLETTTTPETFDDTKIVTNETAPVMTGYKTYALFGIDHRSKNASLGTDNSDTIIIASVNNDTKDVRLVSVYRDTLLNIGGGTYAKANAAYAYGGAEQAISMLNTNLDLNITDYATVDFNALTAAVDAVGGLEIPLSYAEIVHLNSYCEETSVETGKEYTPLELPEPRPEDIEAIVDIYHLNGVQSTSYCRIRYTASLDMGRTERQRRVLQMLMDKGKKAGLTTLFRIMDEVFPLVTTSLTKTEILTMIPTVIGYHMDETVGFPMNFKFSNARGSIIVADTLENNVRQLHQFLYGPDENYVPSQNILDASAKILEIAGGADNLVEEAPPVAEGENVNTDFFWQDDGSGGNAWDDGNGGYVDPNADGGQYQGEGEVVDPDTGGGETGGDTYTEPDGGDGSSGEGAGGDAYVDPGTGGGDAYVDPGAGGGDTYVDPGAGGGDAYVDPGTGGDGGGDAYVDPGTGGDAYVDPGTGGDGGGDVYVDPGAGGEEFLDAGDLSLDIGE